MDCMKKIRAIFSSWVGRENHFKKIATLGSTRIIQLPNGEYHVLGGPLTGFSSINTSVSTCKTSESLLLTKEKLKNFLCF